MKLKQLGLILLLAFLTISLASCSSTEEHLWLKSPDWSRAVLLGGTTTKSPAPMVLTVDGNIYTLLTETDRESSTSTIDLAYFASKTGTVNLIPLNITAQYPKQLGLVREDGLLRLYWIENESLYTVAIQTDGTLVNTPEILSGENVVGSYSLAYSPDGNATLWYAGTRKSPGIYALSVENQTVSSTQVDPQGVFVCIIYDDAGRLHAGWVYYPYGYEATQIRYAVDTDDVITVQRLQLGTSTTLDDFSVGLDKEQLYFFWTTTVRSGLQAGTIRAFYTNFPVGQVAAEQRPQEIWVPAIHSLEFRNMPGGFDVGQRVSLDVVDFPATNELQDITTNPVVANEMVVAFRSPSEHLWRKTRLQVNLAYFRDGRPFAYQPLSLTSTVSSFPNIISNHNGNLYVTWLERQEDNWYSVYLAGTEPTIVRVLDDLTIKEVGDIVLETAFGMLIGALLAPIAAAVWMIAPLIVLLLFAPFGRIRSEKAANVITLISLIVAVSVVWYTKLAVFPALFEYVPFSAWIPEIPNAVGLLLRILMPVLTLVVSSLVAWHYTFRQGNNSSLYFILIYIGIDAIFTTAIYAVLIYGTIIQ